MHQTALLCASPGAFSPWPGQISQTHAMHCSSCTSWCQTGSSRPRTGSCTCSTLCAIWHFRTRLRQHLETPAESYLGFGKLVPLLSLYTCRPHKSRSCPGLPLRWSKSYHLAWLMVIRPHCTLLAQSSTEISPRAQPSTVNGCPCLITHPAATPAPRCLRTAPVRVGPQTCRGPACLAARVRHQVKLCLVINVHSQIFFVFSRL
jgi:hypothetical protein